MKAQVRIERANEVGMLLAVSERPEDAIGELADVALGPAKDEGVRAEIVEHRDSPVAAHRATEDDSLLRLQKREVRPRRAAFRPPDAGRERLVSVGASETRAERLRVRARVDGTRELAQRRDDPRARANHPRVGDELGDRDAEARRRGRVP
jgi:hypothetical protein